MKKPLKDYLLSLAIGLAIAILVFFVAKKEGQLLSRLCDSCFAAAALLLGAAGVWQGSNSGMFHIFNFGIRSVFYTAWPVADKRTPEEQRETYGDYVHRRQSRKMKSPKGTCLAGLTWLAAAAVLLIGYYLL